MSVGYKIKYKPEDFCVNEIASIKIKDKGEYCVYRLNKVGWNTYDAIKKISKVFKIPLSKFSYGGKKDRHAITSQIITIKDKNKIINFNEKNITLTFLGFSDEPMTASHIVNNEFKITVRNLVVSREFLQNRLKDVLEGGFINYFDDQRFGSYDKEQGFIAEKILKKHYSGALKTYLTKIHPEDKKEEKERKKEIFDYWRDWNTCLKFAKYKLEKDIFNHLIKKPNDFLTPLKLIPKEEMSLFFSAFQSYLWNETVRRFLISKFNAEDLLIHKGSCVDFLFPIKGSSKDFESIKTLTLQTASQKMHIKNPELSFIFKNLLDELNIHIGMFNLRDIRHAYFKSTERNLVEIPKIFSYNIDEDEIHKNKLKIELEFKLPAGSYATMLIKRIFAHKLNKKS